MGIVSEILELERIEQENDNKDLSAIPAALNQLFLTREASRKARLDELLVNAKIQEAQSKSMQNQFLQQILGQQFGGQLGEGGSEGSGGQSPVELESFEIAGFNFGIPGVAEKKQRRSEETKREFKSKKDFDSFISQGSDVALALDKLEERAVALGDFDRGFVNQLVSRADIARREFAKDKAVTEYFSALNQELIPLARKVAEEKGPINEADVARLQKGLTDATTPIEDKMTAINDMRKKIDNQIKTKAKLAKIGLDDVKNNFPELDLSVFQKVERLGQEDLESDDGLSEFRDFKVGDSVPDSLAEQFPQLRGKKIKKLRFKRKR